MVQWNVFNRNLNSHNAVWATPKEFFDDINEYVTSCQYIDYEKINKEEGGNELERLTNFKGEPIIKWYKLPTVTGFCASKGILRETYYNQRKRKNATFGLIMDYFSNVISEAAEQCLIEGKNTKSYRGAVYMLESKDRALKRKQTEIENKNKNELSKIQIEAAKVQIKVMEARINQMKSKKLEDPYISTFLDDLHESMNNILDDINDKN